MTTNATHPGQARLQTNMEVRYFKAVLHHAAGWRDGCDSRATEFGNLRVDRARAIDAYAERLIADLRSTG